ncbi:hypothetical protein HDU76_001429 [Blyttiomyces sp. JEL0837]|nr:hypothetical protein HDU76_001429 [Blyttiomyces sp. JEL0837]
MVTCGTALFSFPGASFKLITDRLAPFFVGNFNPCTVDVARLSSVIDIPLFLFAISIIRGTMSKALLIMLTTQIITFSVINIEMVGVVAETFVIVNIVNASMLKKIAQEARDPDQEENVAYQNVDHNFAEASPLFGIVEDTGMKGNRVIVIGNIAKRVK